MQKVLKKVTDNWFVFFGYFSLFLLTVIAALQIYDSNLKITDRYRDLANEANTKLTLLLKSRQNLAEIKTITIDKVFHPSAVTPEKELKLIQLFNDNDNNLKEYKIFAGKEKEAAAFKNLEEAWEVNKKTASIFMGLKNNQDEAVSYYRSTQQKSYENLGKAISSLSQILAKEIKAKEALANDYFQQSLTFINVLIVIRVIILIIIGLIILKVVSGLRKRNKTLLMTQSELIHNQAHLLASQQISKTGSWEITLTEAGEIKKNTLIWSDETYRIFGYEPGEIEATGELFYSHLAENDQMLIKEALETSLKTGETFEMEHSIVLQSGETKIVYERSNIFYDSNGKPQRMIGTCQDITERKMAEQRLTESEREKHRLKDEINKEKINRQKEITKATIIAQEKERLELGRELHDNVNQILSTSKLFIENSFYNPDRQEEMLNKSKNLISCSIEELRKLSRFLAPPTLGDLTLKESIEEIVSEYNQIDSKKSIRYTIIDLNEDKLSDELKISIYRIIQEQLNNIHKYANAAKVHILLKHDENKIALHIEDDGCGFDVRAKRKGHGITNIINRAETFNGDIQIVSSPENGCSIFINFKLNKASVVRMSKQEEAEQKIYGTGS
jgi:two-component system sensor histidine kinase UhpB